MRPEEYDILSLIPQRRPFVLVDRLVRCDARDAVTSFVVSQECLLCDDGVLQPHGIIENMAQSCAARIGYLSLQKSGAVGIGVIGSVSDFTFSRLPHVGERVETVITIDEEVFNFTLVSARVTGEDGELMASARMKIALI